MIAEAGSTFPLTGDSAGAVLPRRRRCDGESSSAKRDASALLDRQHRRLRNTVASRCNDGPRKRQRNHVADIRWNLDLHAARHGSTRDGDLTEGAEVAAEVN